MRHSPNPQQILFILLYLLTIPPMRHSPNKLESERDEARF